jgi:hypothetical protein
VRLQLPTLLLLRYEVARPKTLEGRKAKQKAPKGKNTTEESQGESNHHSPNQVLPTSNKMQKSLIIIDAWEETHSRNFTVFQPFTKIIRSIYDRSIHGGGA